MQECRASINGHKAIPKKEVYNDLTSKIKLDSKEFVKDHICSIKNYLL